MNPKQTARFGSDQIVAHKTQLALSALALAVGVAAVFGLIALGTGSQATVLAAPVSVSTVHDATDHTVVTSTMATLLGTTANYLSIDHDTVTAGRAFTDADTAAHARVALIGRTVAADLTYGDESSLLGKQVLLAAQAFTVIGILASRGYSGNTDLDDAIIAPITAVQDALHDDDPQGNQPAAPAPAQGA